MNSYGGFRCSLLRIGIEEKDRQQCHPFLGTCKQKGLLSSPSLLAKLKPLKFLTGVLKQVLLGATAAVLSRPDPTRLEKLSGKMRWRGNWRRRIFREKMSKNHFSLKVTLKNFWRQLIVEIRTMGVAAQLAEMSPRHQMSGVRIPTSAKLSNVSVNLSIERKDENYEQVVLFI